MTDDSGGRYDLGGCTVTTIRGGSLKLDGGAMFGLIPKPLWARIYPADEQNRITLACNCLLVEWPGRPNRRTIIETGHGPKYNEKEQKIYGIDPANWLLPALVARGIDPASITDVVVSHLHFDHAGGLTHKRDGQLVLTFPQAQVHVQRQEFEDARANFGIMTMTYREENLAPIDEAGQWRLLDGAQEIVPGIRALPTPGHTRGHHSIVIEGEQRAMVFAGDLMPTRHHVGAPYNMGYDLLPLENRESKRRLLSWIAEQEGLLAIDHDVEWPVVAVRPAGEWFEVTPASEDPA
jgi:glyoxylase-like metal-dependent hydrolase (beta-lactamase superfamily II)